MTKTQARKRLKEMADGRPYMLTQEEFHYTKALRLPKKMEYSVYIQDVGIFLGDSWENAIKGLEDLL